MDNRYQRLAKLANLCDKVGLYEKAATIDSKLAGIFDFFSKKKPQEQGTKNNLSLESAEEASKRAEEADAALEALNGSRHGHVEHADAAAKAHREAAEAHRRAGSEKSSLHDYRAKEREKSSRLQREADERANPKHHEFRPFGGEGRPVWENNDQGLIDPLNGKPWAPWNRPGQ